MAAVSSAPARCGHGNGGGKTANVPLPRPNRCILGVEEVEENTAEL